MLFNSPQFIFGFLPLTLLIFFIFGRFGARRLAILWLGFASLVFYGFDNPRLQLPLILASILFNFLIGKSLARANSRAVLVVGVAGNLLLLAFFKYAGLLGETAGYLTGLPLPRIDIPLPSGISFYTFTQIAFLVDVYRRQAAEYELPKYGLFVTIFPHLIAGPILHHRETVPQFDHGEFLRPQPDCIALGLGYFTLGLFKKVMLADSLAPIADAAFGAAAGGTALTLADAWLGTIAYALQIYFDFSGYSDMAIGLALMFGITFPLNFNSPYQATSLIDFWRRWHMTLSRFLRDYLYIPLGGSRRGRFRRHLNLMITMLLGGLWHGASWNFVVWGALHGAGLVLNHLWRSLAAQTGLRIPPVLGWLMTAALVIVAWVPFRADTLATSLVMWKAMVGLGAGSPMAASAANLALITSLGLIALLAPNTQQILSHPWQPTAARLKWAPRPAWALALGCLFGVAAAATFSAQSVFLYFRF